MITTMEYIMNPKMPYLPPEMIDEILLNIEDAYDLMNTIKALLLTHLYYDALANDNYIWKQLIKKHYPFLHPLYTINPKENKLKILFTLLNSFPNGLNEENWRIANEIHTIVTPMVITYYFIKAEIGLKCRNMDYRLIKKLFDTEYIKNTSSPHNSRFSNRELLVNSIKNTYHACVFTNNKWGITFRTFINKVFPTIGKELVYCEQRIPRLTLDEEDPYLNLLVNHADEIQSILNSKSYHFYSLNKIE